MNNKDRFIISSVIFAVSIMIILLAIVLSNLDQCWTDIVNNILLHQIRSEN